MPYGIGYGPLPVPIGLQQPDPLQNALLGVPSGLMGPDQAIMIPPPVFDEEPAPIPAPASLRAEAQDAPAPVPPWLQQAQSAGQAVEAVPAPAAPAEPADELGGFAIPEGVDPDGPIGLTLRASEVRRRAQASKVQQLELAGDRIKTAEARTLARQEEIAKRQAAARKRLDEQNAQIQSALKAGPGTSWRGVAQAGMQALGAVLGAAFDRSGTLQKQLPQTMDAIVGEWQQRVQGDFARQIQALQVGREGAQDELDAAMDADRQLEQAGAAARVAIFEEAERNIQLAVERGQLDMAELEQLGIPQQMQAAIEAEKAKGAEIAAEKERKRIESDMELAKAEADITYKLEQAKSERAKRAIDRAQLGLSRDRLELERQARETQSVKDEVDLHDKRLSAALKAKDLEAKDRDRAIILPDGRPILLNSTAEGAQKMAVGKVATARKLGRLVDEIVQASERTGYDPKWLGSAEGQKTRLLWRKLWLSVKDQEELGAITGPDEKVLDDVTGADPTSFSTEALRGTADRLRLLKRTTEDEVDDYLATASSDYVGQRKRFTLPALEAPEAAVPESPEDARGMLLPGTSGARPRIGAGKGDVKPEDFDAAIKTVRNVAAKSVGGEDRDAIVRVQAEELSGALEQARSERERIERERGEVTKRRAVLSKLGGPKAREFEERERALTDEIKTVQEYEKRIAEALKRERRLLWQKAGDPKLRGREEDRAVLKRVESLIGPVAGKPSGGK
jgi:hypothetical protein